MNKLSAKRDSKGKFVSEPIRDRFYAFIEMPSNPNMCWMWKGSLNTRKQPQFSIGKKMRIASRISYEIHKGKIENGLFVCHTCDNPKCVNPTHLWLGTESDNSKDAYMKGRKRLPSRKNI
jgi:hypothetical protein